MEAVQEALGFEGNNAAQENEGHQVGECHEAVENVCAGPHGAYGEVGADEDCSNVNPAVGENGALLLAANQVLQALFRIVSPAQNGGECEEHQGDCQEVGSDGCATGEECETARECFHGDVHAFEAKLRIPSARNHDGKAGHGTNDDGVEEGSGHAHKALTDRFVGLCGSGCDRCRTEACFVTEDTAGDTLLHGDKDGAYHTAGHSAGVECCTDDSLDCFGDCSEVHHEKQHAGENVENCHDRHDVGGNLGDTLQAADDHEGGECGDQHACDGGGDAHGVAADVHEFSGVGSEAGHSAGNAVHLGDGADAHDAGADAENSEEHCEPLHVPAETFLNAGFDIEEGAAKNLAVGVHLAVLHGQNAFGVLGGHAEEGCKFHPEKGAGAAGSDGGCNTHDVSCSDGSGKGRAKSSKARDFALAALFVVEHVTQGVGEVHHLEAAQADCEKKAYKKNDDNEGNTPNIAIDGIKKSG